MSDNNDTVTAAPLSSASQCIAKNNDLVILQSYYMLGFSIVTIVFMSFFIRRKQLCLNCLHERPAVFQPMNIIDDYGRRWMFLTCYLMLATSLYDFVSDGYTKNWINSHDSEWQKNFKWVSTFILALIVMHIGLIHYPLFACVAHRRHIVSNIAGILYIIPLLVVQCMILSRCPVTADSAFQKIYNIVMVIWRLPAFISHIVYLFGSVFELICNIRHNLTAPQKSPFAEDLSFINKLYKLNEFHHNMMYVKDLMARKTKIEPCEEQQVSFVRRILRSVKNLIVSLKYDNVPGFRYSTRIIGTLGASAIFVCIATILFGVFVDVLLLQLVQFVYDLNFNAMAEYVNVIRIVFHVSSTLSCAIQLLFMGHMLIVYRRRILQLYRGDREWFCQVQLSPSSLLVNAMRYPGSQITFFIFGYMIAMLLVTLIVSAIAVLIIVPLRDRVINFAIDFIIHFWPAIVIGLAIHLGQSLLCRFCFLQDSSALTLNNRRMYFVMAYFMLFFNLFVGVFVAIKRILMSAVIGAVMIGRLDYVVLMRGFERFDSAHLTYLSMLIVDVTHNHPVMRVFIDLLQQHRNHKNSSSSSLTTIQTTVESGLVGLGLPTRNRRVRNKWLKTITLINNPSLIYDRLYQRHQESLHNPLPSACSESTVKRKSLTTDDDYRAKNTAYL